MVGKKNRIPCKYCSKTFASEENYENHKNVHKKSRLKVKCPFCPQLFLNKSNLYPHLATKHPNEEVPNVFESVKVTKKVKKDAPTCDICKISFARNENLVGHLLSFHTASQRKLKCGICAKTFVRSSDLKKHTRKFHSVSIMIYFI